MNKKTYTIPAELNAQRTVNIRGLLVRAALSPFDFPMAADTEFDDGARQFMLRLHYAGPAEHERRYAEYDCVTLYVGEKSARLFRVVVRGIQDRTQIPNIMISAIIKIQKSVENADTGYPYMEWLNYQAVMEFLKKERASILS